jgi:hypothetical protein
MIISIYFSVLYCLYFICKNLLEEDQQNEIITTAIFLNIDTSKSNERKSSEQKLIERIKNPWFIISKVMVAIEYLGKVILFTFFVDAARPYGFWIFFGITLGFCVIGVFMIE